MDRHVIGLTSSLPAPVQALVAAGRRALHGSCASVPPLTGSEAATLPAYARRHGMTAFLPHAAALVFFNLLFLAGAWVSFLRYDVR